MTTQILLSETQATNTYVVAIGEGEHSELVYEYFRLRKSVFIDTLAWEDLDDCNGHEIDEYDNARAVYILITRKETKSVVAGVRLIPTDSNSFLSVFSHHTTSYMLRDAALGYLPNIPASICDSVPPLTPAAVEATRLVATEPGLYKPLIAACLDYFRGSLVQQCYFLTHPAFEKVCQRMGLSIEPLGPVHGQHKQRIRAYSYSVKDEPRFISSQL